MKYLYSLLFLYLVFGCAGKKTVYWCGDHACINQKEKKAYFKETMIVEVRESINQKQINKSEIEKITNEIIMKEKKRTKNEKDLAKQARLEKKNKIKNEKILAKQAKIEEKNRIKREKELLKQKRRVKEKQQKAKITPERKITASTKIDNLDINLNTFENMVEKITAKNEFRKYPDINNIQK